MIGGYVNTLGVHLYRRTTRMNTGGLEAQFPLLPNLDTRHKPVFATDLPGR
jgi:hypothetical protein